MNNDKRHQESPQPSPILFFRHIPDAYMTEASVANGHQSIDSALVLISLGRFSSAYVTLVSSIEAFLTKPGYHDDHPDKRLFHTKILDFSRENGGALASFRFKKNKFDPDENLDRFRNLRNTITHSGYSSVYDNASAEQMLEVAFPVLSIIYQKLFDHSLDDALLIEISEKLRDARSIWLQDRARAASAFKPLVWSLQRLLSPNFEPGFMWNSEGYRRDFGDLVFRATEELRSQGKFDLTETLFCPVCGEWSVVADFEFDNQQEPFGLHIERAACANCRLRLQSNPGDRAISNVLFAEFLDEYQARLMKEFGLS